MTQRIIHRLPTADAVALAAADAAIERILTLQQTQQRVDIAITGGTVGIKTLAVWRGHAKRDLIDYDRVHFWWGDERFVAADSADRNFNQAWDALLAHIDVPSQNLHQFPAADAGLDLEQARESFEQHWLEQAPTIEFGFMGMGPDGHVASLFPGKPAAPEHHDVIAEHDSPKPPPQRLSLSYGAIGSFNEIWFTIAGADKAEPTSVALSDDPERLPVGRIHGRNADVWFIDEAAASLL